MCPSSRQFFVKILPADGEAIKLLPCRPILDDAWHIWRSGSRNANRGKRWKICVRQKQLSEVEITIEMFDTPCLPTS